MSRVFGACATLPITYNTRNYGCGGGVLNENDGLGDEVVLSEPKALYVSNTGTNSSTNGRVSTSPLATIEYAIGLIQADTDPFGWTIIVLSDLQTAGEIVVPPFTTVLGKNFQRRTKITPLPGSEESNVFLCHNGVHIVNLKFSGWRIDSFTNPTKGFAMAFAPGAIILPGGVPYGQNCVVTSAFTAVPTPLPNDYENSNPAQPRGGGCVLADAAVISSYSVFPNIMTWGFTPASQNGIGFVAKNRAHINCVNAIGVGAHIHFMAQSGGNLVLSACSSQFGDYSLWSEGSVNQIVPLAVDPADITTQVGGRSAIEGIKSALVDAANAYISGLQSWTTEQAALHAKDTGLIADAIGVAIQFGSDRPMQNVAEGLFKFTGESVFPYSQLANWKLSFTFIENYILSNTSFTVQTDAFISAMFARLVDTLDNYFYEQDDSRPAPSPVEPVSKRLRSLVTAISHQWTAPLSGTEFYKVPPAKASRRIARTIVQKNGGKVRYSGQDDRGNAVFVGGLVIDSRSGELGGPPFDNAIRTRITRNVIARSY